MDKHVKSSYCQNFTVNRQHIICIVIKIIFGYFLLIIVATSTIIKGKQCYMSEIAIIISCQCELVIDIFGKKRKPAIHSIMLVSPSRRNFVSVYFSHRAKNNTGACCVCFSCVTLVLVIYAMEARITAIFSSILQGTDSEELSRLVDAAISAGIRAESDLKYLAQDDICHVLPPIQVRKLLQHLSSPCTEQPATTGSCAMQATVSASSISATTATTTAETVDSGGNNNWVNTFKIPWAKCPESLFLSIDEGLQPDPKDLRLLITHTMSDICCITRRASRQDLRSVARKIVDRNPSAFADFVNGEVIGDGVGSIMLMLEAKKENMNRPSVSSDAFPTSKQKSSASRQYGCSSWEPSFPSNETGDSLEKMRMHLVALFTTQPDSPEADTVMSTTFCLQRQMINSGMNVNDILQNWPFLGKSVQLTSHFLKLTNVDIAVRLRSAVELKAAMLYEFFSSERQTNMELKRAVDKIGVITMESHQYLHNGLFLLLMAYFRESTSSMISFQQVWIRDRPKFVFVFGAENDEI